jgi:hypothetical protein
MLNTILWWFVGIGFVVTLYYKREAIAALLKDQLDFQKELSQAKRESFRKARLEQAREEGKKLANPKREKSNIEKLIYGEE